MLLFVIWAFAASALMAWVAIQGYITEGGISGETSLVFGLFALAGIPAWLIVAALTGVRWRQTSPRTAALLNTPALVALLLYAAAYLQWSK